MSVRGGANIVRLFVYQWQVAVSTWYVFCLQWTFHSVKRRKCFSLQAHLRMGGIASRVCYLFCIALSDGLNVVLPSPRLCGQIVEIVRLLILAQPNCKQKRLPFLSLPATLRGRLARCTSCTLHCCICVTAMILLAVSSPTSLTLPSAEVGVIYSVGLGPLPQNIHRIVAIPPSPLDLPRSATSEQWVRQ